MSLKKILSNFKIPKSLKEIELNNILDKISNKIHLNINERSFLDSYIQIDEDELKSWIMLSNITASEKIKSLLESKKIVVCNLKDRDGKIDSQILGVSNSEDLDYTILKLKNGLNFKMKDNFLYNLIFDIKKNIYSLESSDEFYEKIKV